MNAGDSINNLNAMGHALQSDLNAITTDAEALLQKARLAVSHQAKQADDSRQPSADTVTHITITMPLGGALLKSCHDNRMNDALLTFLLSGNDRSCGDLINQRYTSSPTGAHGTPNWSRDLNYASSDLGIALPPLTSSRISVDSGTKDNWKTKFYSPTDWTSAGPILWYDNLPSWWTNG